MYATPRKAEEHIWGTMRAEAEPTLSPFTRWIVVSLLIALLMYESLTANAQQERKDPKKKCHELAQEYQNKFKSVVPLSSEEFIENYDPATVVLVDCRTEPEQKVSMIEGAVALQDLDVLNIPENMKIVTYCTIGYRSSFEALRLQDMTGRQVYSLDGIVSYTHALQEKKNKGPSLISPLTKQVTNEVHIFHKMWDLAAPNYQAKGYSLPMFLVRLIQVGTKSTLRSVQHLLHKCNLTKH